MLCISHIKYVKASASSDFERLRLRPNRVQTALFMTQIQVMWEIAFMRYLRPFSHFGLQSGNRGFLLFLLSPFHKKCFRCVEINLNVFIRFQCMNMNTFMFTTVHRGIENRSKVPRFSCPFLVPICIIKSIDMKIA